MKMSKRTKKFFASAALLSLVAGLSFAETHETLKAHTLETGVGNISFGAWGRSTFNVGRSNTSTKITVDETALGKTASTAGTAAIEDYIANGGGTAFNAETDDVKDYATAVGTYAATQWATANTSDLTQAAIAAGATDAASIGAYIKAAANEYGTQVGNAVAGAVIVSMLKAQEKDVSESKNYASLAPDWSYGARVGFWIIGRTPDEHFGFDFNLDADARALFVHKLWDSDEAAADVNYNEDGKYAVAIGDQAKIWGLFDNPLFQTKLAFGRMRENELRGSIGDFGQRESGDVKSEDDIFQEIWTATGLFASIKGNEDSALKGFYMNGAVDIAGVLGLESATDTDSEKSMQLYDALRDAQFGVGYTVPGLFQIKSQFWGDSIAESNYRYSANKYKDARAAGYDMNDYYGRMEFGIDWLGFMGGANGLGDVDLEKTPNANLIELGVKVPIVTREGLRDYDPEKFYNWYACLGTMGVIEKGFILYKGHLWGGQGTSNLSQYSYGLVDMAKDNGANIVMAGGDFLAEVCANPFGKQDVFIGLSGNYNITSANGDGDMKSGLTVNDLKLRQHKIGCEVYVKKTFAANNFIFAGIAGDFTIQSMEGNVNGLVDLKYDGKTSKFYMPIGIEMFF